MIFKKIIVFIVFFIFLITLGVDFAYGANEKDLAAVAWDDQLFAEMVEATLIRVDGNDDQGSEYKLFQATHQTKGRLYEDAEGEERATTQSIVDDGDEKLYLKGEKEGFLPGEWSSAILQAIIAYDPIEAAFELAESPDIGKFMDIAGGKDYKIYADNYGNIVDTEYNLIVPGYTISDKIIAQYMTDAEVDKVKWDSIKDQISAINIDNAAEIIPVAGIDDIPDYFKRYNDKLLNDPIFRSEVAATLVEKSKAYAEKRNGAFTDAMESNPDEFEFGKTISDAVESDSDVEDMIKEILTGGAGKLIKLTASNIFFDAYEEWIMNFSGRVIFYTFTTEEIGMNQLKSVFMVVIVLGIMVFITISIYRIIIGKITLQDLLKQVVLMIVILLAPLVVYDRAIQFFFNETNILLMSKNIEKLMVMDRWNMIAELSADEEAKAGSKIAANYEFRSQNYNYIMVFNTNQYSDYAEAQDKLNKLKQSATSEEYKYEKTKLSDKRVKLFVDANHLMNWLNKTAKTGEIPKKNDLFEYLSGLERDDEGLTTDRMYYPGLKNMLAKSVYSIYDDENRADKFGEATEYIVDSENDPGSQFLTLSAPNTRFLDPTRFGSEREVSASQIMAAVMIFYGAGSYDGTSPDVWKEIVNTNAAVETWLTQAAEKLGTNKDRFNAIMVDKSVTFSVTDEGYIEYKTGTSLMDDEKLLIASFKQGAEAILAATPEVKESIIKVCAHPQVFLSCDSNGKFVLHDGGKVDVMDTTAPDADDNKDTIAKAVEDEPFEVAIKVKALTDFLVDSDLQLTSIERTAWINRASHTKGFNTEVYGGPISVADSKVDSFSGDNEGRNETIREAIQKREEMLYNNILEGGDICNVEDMLKSFCTFDNADELELMVVNINTRVIEKYMDTMYITREAAAKSDSEFAGLYNNSEGDILKMYIALETLKEFESELFPAGISVDRTEVDAYFRTLIVPLLEMKPDNEHIDNAAVFTGMHLSSVTMIVFMLLVFMLLVYGVVKTLVITVALLPYYLVVGFYRYIYKTETSKIWFGAVYVFAIFTACHAGLMLLWYVVPMYSNIASVDYDKVGSLASIMGPLLSILIMVLYLAIVLLLVYKPTIKTIWENPSDMGGEIFYNQVTSAWDKMKDTLTPGTSDNNSQGETVTMAEPEKDPELMIADIFDDIDTDSVQNNEEKTERFNAELARRDAARLDSAEVDSALVDSALVDSATAEGPVLVDSATSVITDDPAQDVIADSTDPALVGGAGPIQVEGTDPALIEGDDSNPVLIEGNNSNPVLIDSALEDSAGLVEGDDSTPVLVADDLVDSPASPPILADAAIADDGLVDKALGVVDNLNADLIALDNPGVKAYHAIFGNALDADSFAMYGPIAGATENLVKKALGDSDTGKLGEVVNKFKPRQMAKDYIPDIDFPDFTNDEPLKDRP